MFEILPFPYFRLGLPDNFELEEELEDEDELLLDFERIEYSIGL